MRKTSFWPAVVAFALIAAPSVSLAEKFRLDRRGYGYTPEELSAVLRDIAADIQGEAGFDA